ncbi:MAG: hypothetical protein IMZ50_08800 [Candidatus Atribacteria bacterium]|nr:hypothetical protein [Candidatus Atribacteria bacterium]
MAKHIGILSAIMSLNAQAFEKALARQAKSVDKFAADISRVGRTVTAIGVGMAAPLVLSVRTFMKQGDELAKAAKRIGITTEAMAGLKHAAELGGASVDSVTVGIGRLSRNLYDAERGLTTATDAFGALGINFKELKGLSPDEQFIRVGAAVGSLSDESQKLALSLVLMGRGAAELIPLFNEGAGAMRKQMRAGSELLGLNQKQSEMAEELEDDFTRLTTAAVGLQMQIGAALAPAMIKLTEAMTKATIALRDYVSANPQAVTAWAQSTVAVLSFGAALMAVGLTTKLIATSMVGLRVAALATAKAFTWLKGSTLAAGMVTGAAVAGVWLLTRHYVDLDKAVKGLNDTYANADTTNLNAVKNRLNEIRITLQNLQAEANDPAFTDPAWYDLSAQLAAPERARNIEAAATALEKERASLEALLPNLKAVAETTAKGGMAADMLNDNIAKVVTKLEAESRALSMTKAGLQEFALAEAGAGEETIAFAESLREKNRLMSESGDATKSIADKVRDYTESLQMEIDTWGMASREAEHYRLATDLVNAEQKLSSIVIDETTQAYYEQSKATVEAARAALRMARAQEDSLDILERRRREEDALNASLDSEMQKQTALRNYRAGEVLSGVNARNIESYNRLRSTGSIAESVAPAMRTKPWAETTGGATGVANDKQNRIGTAQVDGIKAGLTEAKKQTGLLRLIADMGIF